MDIKKVFDNNKEWVKAQLEKPDYFKNLAAGQSPEILYIGCSDSRVTAEELMGLQPGDVFVQHRLECIIGDKLRCSAFKSKPCCCLWSLQLWWCKSRYGAIRFRNNESMAKKHKRCLQIA